MTFQSRAAGFEPGTSRPERSLSQFRAGKSHGCVLSLCGSEIRNSLFINDGSLPPNTTVWRRSTPFPRQLGEPELTFCTTFCQCEVRRSPATSIVRSVAPDVRVRGLVGAPIPREAAVKGGHGPAQRTLDGRVVASPEVPQWNGPGAEAPGLDASGVAPYGTTGIPRCRFPRASPSCQTIRMIVASTPLSGRLSFAIQGSRSNGLRAKEGTNGFASLSRSGSRSGRRTASRALCRRQRIWGGCVLSSTQHDDGTCGVPRWRVRRQPGLR